MKNNDKQKEIDVQNFVADYYEQVRYKNKHSIKYHNFWFEKMVDMAKPKGLILDNGCGTGELIAYLRNMGATNVIGCDISENMLKHARQKTDRVVLADSESLPFESGAFDVVYVRALLHHLEDVPKAVSEVARVLKNGGRVVFAETNKSIINDLPRKIMKRGEHFSESHKNFDAKELISVIGKSLKVEKVEYFGYLGYFLLGFPDINNIYRFFPFKKILTPLLIKTDSLLSHIPFVKKLAFCIMVSARKE